MYDSISPLSDAIAIEVMGWDEVPPRQEWWPTMSLVHAMRVLVAMEEKWQCERWALDYKAGAEAAVGLQIRGEWMFRMSRYSVADAICQAALAGVRRLRERDAEIEEFMGGIVS